MVQSSFEVTIEEISHNATVDYETLPKTEYLHQKMSLQLLLYRLLLLKEGHLLLKDSGLNPKMDERWTKLKQKIFEHLNSIVSLAQ